MVSHRIEEVQPEPFHQQPNQRPSPSLKGSEIGEKTRSPGALPAEIKRLIARMAEKPVEKVDHGAETQEVETITPPSSDHVSGEKATSTPDVYEESHVHHTMNFQLFMGLTAMSFLWVGSQIPLYLFGSVLPRIYQDIGGVDRYTWFVIGYLIPNAALCPFVGALSDLFGRRYVAAFGQVCLLVGPIITATATNMNNAIAGQVFSGLGAGLNELIALAGTAEMVPVAKRGMYVGLVVFTILPFCPSVVYAQLIAEASNWRYNGILVCIWNFLGLVFVWFFYKDPPKPADALSNREILARVDYIGGALSIGGVLCFMMGMQWGGNQYEWGSAHVLAPFILGIIMIIAFFVYEVKFAKYPMCPPQLFSKAKRTMIIILLITFLSGGNFFVLLLFWPTQIYNVYGDDPIGIGIRSLPIGFGVIAGAVIALMAIPLTKGRIKLIFIVATALMTAFCGAVSISTPHNLNIMYVIVTFGALGVGGVIIPSSIIAQIVCPPELIATITAITLAIRYIGGAIGYTAYYNVFYAYFEDYATDIVAVKTIVLQGIVSPKYPDLIEGLVLLTANAQFTALRETIATDPRVMRKDVAEELIVSACQEAFALGYRYPYWMSIAFGSICLILAMFLGDISKFMTPDVAASRRGSRSALPATAV